VIEKKEVINDREYTFKKFGFKENIEIRNNSFRMNIETKEQEVLVGTMQALTVLHSLKSGLKDSNGKEVPITKDNFYAHFPMEDFDQAFMIAQELNSLTLTEKNA